MPLGLLAFGLELAGHLSPRSYLVLHNGHFGNYRPQNTSKSRDIGGLSEFQSSYLADLPRVVNNDVLALAWPESHGFGFPKSEARPHGFGLALASFGLKARKPWLLAGFEDNSWLWPDKIPGQAKAKSVIGRPKPRPSQKATAFWPEAKARTSLVVNLAFLRFF
ncbi:hypothetical protein FB451DRAFT_1363636 [Mycena latifolia]|nr:hypothetical protein FB451DRAFT_1363636 [Mycena latifolia]